MSNFPIHNKESLHNEIQKNIIDLSNKLICYDDQFTKEFRKCPMQVWIAATDGKKYMISICLKEIGNG